MTLTDWFYMTFVRWPRSVIWTCAVLTVWAVAKLFGTP